jgi:hypothetical protein
MWMKEDSRQALNWEEALMYAEKLEYAGYSDWRLPNAKELQSLVDYSRAPDAGTPTQVGPAIDPVFESTDISLTEEPEYAFYWSGTTHLDGPEANYAVYLAFGRATGWMQVPPNSGNYVLWNVHGAGAQRSDPKSGNPEDFPYGHGPQGDVIRIYNYVRAVRSIGTSTGTGTPWVPGNLLLEQNYPNPFNPSTTIRYSLPGRTETRLDVRDAYGRTVSTLVDGIMEAGSHTVTWDAAGQASGMYFCTLTAGARTAHIRMLLLR